jgi:hypothetical protein
MEMNYESVMCISVSLYLSFSRNKWQRLPEVNSVEYPVTEPGREKLLIQAHTRLFYSSMIYQQLCTKSIPLFSAPKTRKCLCVRKGSS